MVLVVFLCFTVKQLWFKDEEGWSVSQLHHQLAESLCWLDPFPSGKTLRSGWVTERTEDNRTSAGMLEHGAKSPGKDAEAKNKISETAASVEGKRKL